MSKPDVKIGDEVAVVEFRSTLQRKTKIARETPTQWITSDGERFRKRDGAVVPRYLDLNRRIVTVAEYEAGKGRS